MFTFILYALATVLLALSFFRDRKKTKQALKKAWKAFENILPQFLAILLVIGMVLALLTPEQISRILGEETGAFGMVVAAFVGAVTLIPGFVAFPLAAALYENGGGLLQLAVFVTTLMGVGIVTLPVEMACLGKKVAILRNLLAFGFAFVVALCMGGLVG